MKKQTTTQGTAEMLKIINTAATNLILKDKKVSLGAKIKRQQEERDYLRGLVDVAAKKVAALAPELIEAERNAHEARLRYEDVRAQQDELGNRLQKLRELEKKVQQIRLKAAEAATIKESVRLLNERYEGLKSLHAEKTLLKNGLDSRLLALSAEIDSLKKRLSQLNAEQDALSREVSGKRIMEYIHSISKDTEVSLAALSTYQSTGSDMTFPSALHAVIDEYNRLKGLGDLLDSMVRDGMTPADLNREAAVEIVKGLESKITGQLSELLSYERGRVDALRSRKAEIETEMESLKGGIERLRADLNRIETEIASEQEFRDRSQSILKGLNDEASSLKATLERLKKEAEEISANIEFAEVFVEAVTPMVAHLRTVNSNLGIVMDEYSRVCGDMRSALGMY